ncbi:peptide chain release factor 2 [Gammaproteobacteria bacterium]|nr:peptide chain release factor 2 [Gammaproteobacteria bacterium]
MEISGLFTQISELRERVNVLRGHLDLGAKKERLKEIEIELADSSIWNAPDYAQKLGKERASLEAVIDDIEKIQRDIEDTSELLDLAKAENDSNILDEVHLEVREISKALESLEFRKMFSGKVDNSSAYLDIQAGSGGTEAQDWAEMLMRMYLRWGESRGFNAEVIEVSVGDVAGIKGATILFQGEFAYGWFRTETGVHRLVRKSPFDSGNRRHTSFASVFVSPELDDEIEIKLEMSEVRIDTYRASGAGGQHVNKTDSAVRLTHLPSGIAVQCQKERSQHKNKDQAIKQLKAKLFEIEEQKQKAEMQGIEDKKSDITWGSQIRSYVLDSGRVKDLRTGIETSNTQAVLNGDLDNFIEASLKMGL